MTEPRKTQVSFQVFRRIGPGIINPRGIAGYEAPPSLTVREMQATAKVLRWIRQEDQNSIWGLRAELES